jgi:peptidoglycan/LPS O-acetylase OafA/YrhL
MLAPVRSDPASLKRLAVVDGLRGIAILLVIGFHLWNLLPGLSGDRSTGSLDVHLAHLFRSGWIGVDLFFVISGFLLTGHLYDARGSSTYFRAFYVRRALRILPLYYAFLFFLLVVVPRIPGRLSEYLQIDMLRGVQSYYWTYTVNVAGCLRATAGRIPLAHSHIWSLCVEEQFYLFWPAVVLYAGDRRQLMRVFLAVMALAVGMRWLVTLPLISGPFREWAPYALLPCRMDTFAFGGYVALAVRGEAAEIRRLRRLARVLAAGSLVGLAAIYLRQHGLKPFEEPLRTLGMSLLTLGFGALLVLVLDLEPATAWRSAFESRPLMTAAKFSYGLYVVHPSIAFALIPLVAHTWWTRPVLGSFVFANLGFLALAGGASVVVAWASWHLLEKRALALKRFFPYGTAPTSQPREDPMRARA